MNSRFNERGFVIPSPPLPEAPRKTPKWLDRLMNVVLTVFLSAIFLVILGAMLRAMRGFFDAGWNWCGRLIGS